MFDHAKIWTADPWNWKQAYYQLSHAAAFLSLKSYAVVFLKEKFILSRNIKIMLSDILIPKLLFLSFCLPFINLSKSTRNITIFIILPN
jgi:hypothetical protein